MNKIIGDVAILDNGTCWRLPRTKDDLVWHCTWHPESLTQEDFGRIASTLDCYQHMIECMTQKERNNTCEQIKTLMKGETQ